MDAGDKIALHETTLFLIRPQTFCLLAGCRQSFLSNTPLSGEKRVCLFIPIRAEHLAWETPSATEAGLIQSPPGFYPMHLAKGITS